MSLLLDVHHRQGTFTLEARFEAGPGVVALFGASGSGKTTLLNIIAGLAKPESGRVIVGGEILTDTLAGIHVPPHRRRLGYVFQDGRLFPHLTVRQNLDYGRWFAAGRIHGNSRFEQVTSLLALVPLLERAPLGLSGGEKQRVAIGRALLAEPRLLLMDEPLAALDQARREDILPYLERLRDEAGVPIVYVSHALSEVVRLASSVVVLEHGRIIASGPVSEVLTHADQLPAADRGEAGAVIDAVVEAGSGRGGLATLRSAGNRWQVQADGLPAAQGIRLRVRARDVMIALTAPGDISALNILPGRIVELRASGAGATDVLLDCGGDRLVARLTTVSAERLRLAPGLAVHAIVKAVAFEPTH
jgi:molybdate transport system ATP-binding protein